MVTIQELLKDMVDLKASDLHIKVPTGPVFRIDGALIQTEKCKNVEPSDIEKVFDELTNEAQHQTFFKEHELDFAYGIPGLARFRVNVQKQRGSISMVFRLT